MVAENGIFQVHFDGRVSIEEAKQIQSTIFKLGELFGKLGALANLDNFAHFESGARTYLVRPSRPYPMHTVAYFGGNFAARMAIQTMTRAGRLLSPSSFEFDIVGFETEEEARRHLEAAHQKYEKNA